MKEYCLWTRIIQLDKRDVSGKMKIGIWLIYGLVNGKHWQLFIFTVALKESDFDNKGLDF